MDTEIDHDLFHQYPDYNDWVDDNVVIDLALPGAWRAVPRASLALFCGDNPAYLQGLEAFRTQKLNAALGVGVLSADLSGDNVKHFHRLLSLVRKHQVVPFIGAGMSASCGLPTWGGYIENQLRRMGMETDEAAKAVSAGNFEDLVDKIVEDGVGVFERRFIDAFATAKYESSSLKVLPKLFLDVVATTNYDTVLESIFKDAGFEFSDRISGIGDSSLLISALSNKTSALFKIHGNISEPTTRILSKTEYDNAYGNGDIDFSLPLPGKLRYLFQNRSLLFLGCSLGEDRTLSLFNSVVQELGPGMVPEHFALLELPSTISEIAKREKFLGEMKITPIWFPNGEFSYIDNILLALDEA